MIKNDNNTLFNKCIVETPDEWGSKYKLYISPESDDGHRGIAIAKTEKEAKQLVIAKYESFDRSLQTKEDINCGDVIELPIEKYGNYCWG